MRFPFLTRRAPELPAPRDFGYIELRGAATRVLVIPSLGGKIAELWLAGRQWLWQNPLIPMGPPSEGGSYVETADTGGMDECFPTVGACRVPGWVKGAGGVELPDHGELWSQEPAVDVRTSADGQMVVCRWQGVRLPYVFERTVRVDRDGVVHCEYTCRNEGSERLPFVWAAYPQFPLTEQTRVEMTAGTRLRVFARHGIELGEPRSEHQWPFVRGGARAVDFSQPHEVGRKYACKLFLDMADGEANLREGSHVLQFRWNPRDISHFGVWFNKRGWTPFRDEAPYLNCALGPSIGAPDTITEALGDWKAGPWLDAGATRQWGFTMRGIEAPLPSE